MKRLLALALSLLMAFTMLSGCKEEAPKQEYVPPVVDEESGEIVYNSPTAWEVNAEMNLGINLGNTFDAYNADKCDQITYEWIPTVGNNALSFMISP